MRNFISLLVFIIFALSAFSQTTTVKGTIIDTLEKRPISNAVITLIQVKDSFLYKFTRTGKTGQFQFDDVIPGKYLALVTYPGFADFSDQYTFKNDAVNDMGVLPLTLKSKLLAAVIIKSAGAIRIKGDTTEFVADSFKLKEGATVEDLLKRLPGFQVNAKGEITAQGQKVQKVLVDGEEFFGDDPTVATQNIAAKVVDKVQVYDTKSEQQQITGITNNADGKTVNIKLKESSKKGYFGKGFVGSDFNKYVDAKGIFNNFVGKKKISAFVTKSNVNAGNLNWQDRQKLGLENDIDYDDINGYYFSFNTGDEFSDYNLKGLPNATSAGILYSNKWNDEKQGINGSYKYNRLGIVNDDSNYTKTILQNTVNYRNIFSHSNVLNQQHALNGKYEWKLDSLTSFKFVTADLYKTTDLFNNIKSEYLNAEKEYINTSEQTRENHTIRKQSDNQFTYKQLFNKKDRLLLTTLRYGYTQDAQQGYNVDTTHFYHNNISDSISLVDQMRKFNGESKSFGVKSTYVEPISTRLSFIAEYSFNENASSSNRRTYDKSQSNKYDFLDSIYSNNFNLTAFSNSGTALFRYISKKLRFSAGSGISDIKLHLLNDFNNTHYNYDFVKFTPQSQISYAFQAQTRLGFNYRGTTIQPNINQLQPVLDNNDPLNIYKGNPNLKVGFNHNINLFYNSFKVLSGTGIWVNGGIDLQNNAITEYNTIDTTTGKQIYMPVNVNGNHTWYFWGQYYKGDGDKKLHKGIQFNGNGARYVNFVNGQQNITNSYTFNIGIELSYNNPDKFNFNFNPNIGYNKNISSLQPNVSNHYYNYGGNLSGYIMLPGKLELSSEINANLQQKINNFSNGVNIVVWNANLSKKIFKNKSGKISIIANDLLDQNKGINRTITSNYIQDERYSRISRYFLLQFEWTFNKIPGAK